MFYTHFITMMISRTLRSFRVVSLRSCSTAAAPTLSPAPVSASDAANAFNNIMFKGRKKNLIGIRELKSLFITCGPKDAKYAGLGVDWFQEKGFDFSEELNALFVDACVRGEKPQEAVSRFIYRKGRIGAWATPKSLNKLFECLRDKKDPESMVKVLEALIPKNVRVNNVTVILCLTACCEAQSPELYTRVLELTRGSLDEEYMQKIKEKYPLPVAPSVSDGPPAEEEEDKKE